MLISHRPKNPVEEKIGKASALIKYLTHKHGGGFFSTKWWMPKRLITICGYIYTTTNTNDYVVISSEKLFKCSKYVLFIQSVKG